MVADDRIYDLIRLSSRYLIVRDTEEKGAGFALIGHVNDMENLDDWLVASSVFLLPEPPCRRPCY